MMRLAAMSGHFGNVVSDVLALLLAFLPLTLFGQRLGLGHTNVSGATMYPSVSCCDNGPLSIARDDAAGIMELYGSGGGGPACELKQKFESCSADNECCSGKCTGKRGEQSCK